MESLRIRLLGGFSLALGGVPIAPPKSRKAQSLVAFLALHIETAVSREQVAVALWPDKEVAVARFNLRQCLAALRKECPSLSPFLLAPDRTTLCLDRGRVEIDVSRLSDATADFVCGPLLVGFNDEWLASHRARVNEQAIEALASASEGAGGAKAVRYLRQAIALDPYSEPLQRKLLQALGEIGDLVGAEEAMRRYRLLLHQEMRLEPSPEMEQEYRTLLCKPRPANVQRAPKQTHRLPVPLTPILGRGEEIKEIGACFAESRLVTLLGPGGAGKTRLAVAYGVEALEVWRHGVRFVDLGSVQNGEAVSQTVAQALQLSKRSGESWSDLCREFLRDRAALLILDNCEHLVEACADLTEMILREAASVRILATSRLPLAIEGERRFQVLPPGLPVGTPVENYRRYSALQLFEDRARSVSPAFSLRASNVNQVISICRELDGMPLAIEMAAARLGTFSLDTIEQRMPQKLTFLRSPSRSAPPRRRDLNSVIEWSFDLLSLDAQHLLKRLSLFTGGLTTEAASFLCSGRFEDALAELVNASLLRLDGDRYRMFETVKEFAEVQLTDTCDDIEALERAAEYYCRKGQEFHEFGPDQIAERFRPDLDNLRIVLQGCLRHRLTEAGLKLLLSSLPAFAALQLDGEAGSFLREFLASDSLGRKSPLRLRALARASIVYQSQYSDLERDEARRLTVETCRELKNVATEVGDRAALAEAQLNLGRIYLWWRADLAKSELTEALSICDDRTRPSILRLLGQHAYDAKDFELAEESFLKARECSQRVGNVTELIHSLGAESHLLREMGRTDEALQRLFEIEWILERRLDARTHAFNQLRFAELYLDRWDFESMKVPLEAAKAFFGASRKRLHGLLIDGLCRYLAAFTGDYPAVLAQFSDVVGELVRNGKLHPSAYWHGACVEFEALTLTLAKLGHVEEAHRMFGVAQSLRERDWAFLSPGVRRRWQQLAEHAGLDSSHSAFAEGKNLDPDEAFHAAQSFERKIASFLKYQPPCSTDTELSPPFAT
ncbi:MAG TPA: BTAD domain-containing putative transcriptional regulator [Fimbriimonas sp.]|nr:BTAD domain-containing putative transcriptional regulator [Fimbriimonas sp.]